MLLTVTEEEVELFQSKYGTVLLVSLCVGVTACNFLPDVKVWLKKVDFEVAPDANKGEPFPCHIVIAYSQDLHDRLSGMDAQGYFPNYEAMQKKFKDSIEIFKYDMIPGKNKLDQKIKLKSYKKAISAFLFARYSTPGKFMENIGDAASLVVRFLPYKMEVISESSLDAVLNKGKN
ncbi:MAG: hypothetical protein LBE97_01210 [Holosporales bacterium]|jgi:hypothetical protein|nr:hypothetical protein [Holosporales bacterium]